jgi:hypothetical protein
LEDDLLAGVEESRSSGKVLGAFNSTFLPLIPKQDDPNSFEVFSPISLCNAIYKIIAKVIARSINHKANPLKGNLSITV